MNRAAGEVSASAEGVVGNRGRVELSVALEHALHFLQADEAFRVVGDDDKFCVQGRDNLFQ